MQQLFSGNKSFAKFGKGQPNKAKVPYSGGFPVALSWRAFLKTPENFSGPKTLRGAFRVFFSGPEKCFSEHPKVSRIVSRYFRESFRVRAGKIILEHGFFYSTISIFSSGKL